jgi:ssDNA-binding Zn-finger/Zn-ribbon topoisomerase 1
MDQVIRSVEPTLGQEKTKAFKRNLESKKLFKKAEARKIEKQTENKAKGGRVGRKGGGGLGAQSVKYGLDDNYDVTAADPKAKFIAAAKNKKKKLKKFDSPMAKAVKKKDKKKVIV